MRLAQWLESCSSAVMINATQIKPNTPVVCSNNGQFAVVDHMAGTENIKLMKDDKGVHHYIPLKWVTKVDDKIHVDRPGAQAMRDWSKTAPVEAASTAPGGAAPPAKVVAPPAAKSGVTPAAKV
jgi:hypothetical protein